MKKIIGFLGVAVFALAMFFNTNSNNASNGNFSLSSLLTLNTANAESPDGTYWIKKHFDCTVTVTGEGGASVTIFGSTYTIPYSGSLTVTSNVGVDCDVNGPSQCTVFDCHEIG